MRTKLLCLLGAVAALTVPASGHAGIGGQAQVFETVTLEADALVPVLEANVLVNVPAHLIVTTRVRRYAATHLNQWALPGQLPVANLDDASSWLELRDRTDGSLLCRSAAPMATVTADQSDVISAATTDLSCPLTLEVTGSGEQRPFARSVAVRGPGLENGFEVGYDRPGTVASARINGVDTILERVTITRSRRVSVMPYAS